MDEKKILRIQVYPNAHAIVKAFADRFDMTEQGVASRMYEWFGSKPLPVQKWVIGLTDGDEGRGMRIFAEKLLQAAPQAPGGAVKGHSIPRKKRAALDPAKPVKPLPQESADDEEKKSKDRSK